MRVPYTGGPGSRTGVAGNRLAGDRRSAPLRAVVLVVDITLVVPNSVVVTVVGLFVVVLSVLDLPMSVVTVVTLGLIQTVTLLVAAAGDHT